MIVTRASNNYGPHQFPEKIIPLFITNALDDIPVPLYGDGLNERDWLHVGDHCRAIDRLIDDGQSGEVYNIGGGNNVRNIDLTHQILDLLGKPETPDPARRRPAGPRSALLPRHGQGAIARLGAAGTVRAGSGGHGRVVPRKRMVVAPDQAGRSGVPRLLSQSGPARAGPDPLPCLVHRWSRGRQDLRAAISSTTSSSTTSASRPGATLSDVTIRSRRTVASGGTASISSTPTISHARSNR